MNLTEQDQQKNEMPTQGQATPKVSTYPTFADLAAIFGVLIIGQVLGVLIANITLILSGAQLPADEMQGWIMFIAQCVTIVVVLAFIPILRKLRKAPKVKLNYSKYGLNPTVLLGGVLMMLSMSVIIEPLLAFLPTPPDVEARGWPMLLTVVIVAPIFEEILCRGMIFEAVRSKRGLVAAWLISSLFFGLIHIQPAAVVNATMMGLILCYIYIRSRSLIAPIILHVFNNALAYLFILFGWGHSVTLGDLITSTTIYYILYGLSLLILVVSVVVCNRQFSRIIAQSKEQGEQLKEQEEQLIDKEE